MIWAIPKPVNPKMSDKPKKKKKSGRKVPEMETKKL